MLADALLQHGDPRGDFIALQLEGSRLASKRAEKILRRHRERFLGPLACVVSSVDEEWRDGFLWSAHVNLTGTLMDAREWATVGELTVRARAAVSDASVASDRSALPPGDRPRTHPARLNSHTLRARHVLNR